MKTEQHLHQVYADLLPADTDQASAQLVSDLDTLYTTPAPPPQLSATMLRAIEQRMAERQRQASVRRWAFPRAMPRGVGAVAAILVMLLIGGGVYAITPVLNQALTQLDDTGLKQVDAAGLMHDVDLSQTIDGYTIHLQRVYADANRVMVAYTVQGADQKITGFTPNEMHLTTPDGLALPMHGRFGLAKDGGVEGNIFTFDADSIQGHPAEVSLRLEVYGLQVFTSDAPSPPTGQPEEPTTIVSGPFVFDFTVPFVAGRVIDVNQTITANGVPITLDRLLITPSMTRAYFQLQDTNGIPAKEWWPETRLNGDGWTVDWYGGGSSRIEDNRRHVLAFEQALFDKHGEWTLTIERLRGEDPAKRAAAIEKGEAWNQEIIEGPWEFKFVVP
jgi:hypothetical protein